jgi:putative Holliday junction resolvase
MGRIMGIDVGTVRVGIALSDELGLTARPFETVRRGGDRVTARRIRDLAAENEVDRIVVGLPLGLDGREQSSSADARRMAAVLGEETGIEIVVWDERLTTVQAERALIEGNVRREKRREVIDQVAAALMLQSFLDLERARRQEEGGEQEGGP